MIRKNEEKGFTAVDVSIAMIVVVIFVTIMSSMFYSVYLSSTEAKRTSTALNYAVDIFERIGVMSISNVTADGVFDELKDELNIKNITGDNELANCEIGTYKLTMKVIKPYNDNTMKKITLTIDYPVSAKESQTMTLERLKTVDIQ